MSTSVVFLRAYEKGRDFPYAHSDELPMSYRTNNKKERLLLSYADNFQRQFRQLYGDRKLLFLKPPNEFGVQVTEPIDTAF